jgi:hypothetical protein
VSATTPTSGSGGVGSALIAYHTTTQTQTSGILRIRSMKTISQTID